VNFLSPSSWERALWHGARATLPHGSKAAQREWHEPMADMQSPGALANATCAEKPCQVKAAGVSRIKYWIPVGHMVTALASQTAKNREKVDD
jgi:hypothetical protein